MTKGRFFFHAFLVIAAVWGLVPAAPSSTKPLSALKSVRRNLDVGLTVEDSVGPREEHAFEVCATGNSFVRVRIVRKNGTFTLTVTDQRAGLRLATSVDQWAGPEVSFAFICGGQGTISVRPAFARDATYAIEVVEARPVSKGDESRAAAYRIFLAAVSDRSSKRETIERNLVEARRLAEQVGETDLAGESTFALGKFLEGINENQRAEAAYRDCRALWRTNPRPLAAVLDRLGYRLWAAGENSQAGDVLRHALEAARSGESPWSECRALNHLGLVSALIGEKKRAREIYLEALRLAERLDDPALQAEVLDNLGYVHLSTGDRQAAIESFLKSLELVRLTGNMEQEGTSLHGIGYAYTQINQPAKAIDYLKAALAIRRTLGNTRREASTLQRLGDAYVTLGDFTLGQSFLRQASAKYDPTDDTEGKATTLLCLGICQIGQDKFDEARRELARALTLYATIKDEEGRAETLMRLGEAACRAGDLQSAERELAEALGIWRSLGNPERCGLTLSFDALREWKAGRVERAIERIQAAIGYAETARGSYGNPFWRDGFSTYLKTFNDLYVDLLMEQHARNPSGGFDRLAFQVTERARARTFLDLLGEQGIDVTAGVPEHLVAREAEQRGRLAELEQQRLLADAASRGTVEDRAILELQDAHRLTLSEMRRAKQSLDLVFPADIDPLLTLQTRILDAGTMVVEFEFTRDNAYVFVVDRERVLAAKLNEREKIEALARDVRRRLQTPGEASKAHLQSDLARLGALLLGPVERSLTARRLVFVPDGILGYLPFGVLPSSTGRLLVDDREITIAPSATVLGRIGNTVPQRTVAILADPVFSSTDVRVAHRDAPIRDKFSARFQPRFGRLPFSRREATAIAGFVPPENVRQFLDFDANREMLARIGACRVLHFATHGYFNEAHPESSGVVLSLVDRDGRPRNGFLTVADIYGMRLSAELVVLSACESGLGREVRGEGIVGLTRAFLYAGAQRVLISLWKVDDAATGLLMKEFYRELMENGKSPAAALRDAQAAVRKEPRFSHPYYWAGFVLQGNYR